MLAVDRYQFAARLPGEPRHDLTRHHERLLIRDGQPLAGLDRGRGHGQAGGADQRVDYKIGAGIGRECYERLLTHPDFQVASEGGGPGRVLTDGDPDDAEPARLFGEEVGAGQSRQADHLKGVGVGVDDGQHAPSYRAGRSQNRYPFA